MHFGSEDGDDYSQHPYPPPVPSPVFIESKARTDRRERIATAVSVVFAARLKQEDYENYAELAHKAVRWADALIAELDRK